MYVAQAAGADRLDHVLGTSAPIWVNRYTFLHRLYVGLIAQFATSTALHDMLDAFLPQLREIMDRALSRERGQELFDNWRERITESVEAARAADNLGVPTFHWAGIYRI